MRGYRYIVFLIAAILLAGCQREPEVSLSVRECTPLPAGGRASASSCSLNGKGYVFGGRDKDGKYLNDLWQYDPETDTWELIPTFPGKARVHALLTNDGEALYVGLGFSGEKVYEDSCYLQDFWRYTPANGQWEALSSCPNHNTIDGVPYVIDDRIYVLYSTGWSHTNDVIYYDKQTNEWRKIPVGNRIEARFGAAGAQCQNRCFFGTGLGKLNSADWYEVDLATDTWSSRAGIPGKGRELCAYCGTKSYIYLFGGRYFAGEYTGGEVFGDYWRYDVTHNRWECCGSMPCGRGENMIAFSINGKVYFGLGENSNKELIPSLYCIEN